MGDDKQAFDAALEFMRQYMEKSQSDQLAINLLVMSAVLLVFGLIMFLVVRQMINQMRADRALIDGLSKEKTGLTQEVIKVTSECMSVIQGLKQTIDSGQKLDVQQFQQSSEFLSTLQRLTVTVEALNTNIINNRADDRKVVTQGFEGIKEQIKLHTEAIDRITKLVGEKPISDVVSNHVREGVSSIREVLQPLMSIVEQVSGFISQYEERGGEIVKQLGSVETKLLQAIEKVASSMTPASAPPEPVLAGELGIASAP